QQVADPRIVRDAGADQPDALLAAPGHLHDGLAERVDAAVPHRAIHLTLEAEAAPAPASLADLEEGHVPVLRPRRLDGSDRGEGVDVAEPALHDDAGRPLAGPHVGQHAVGAVDNLVALGNVYTLERRERGQEALAVPIAVAVGCDQLDDQLFALAHDDEVHE